MVLTLYLVICYLLVAGSILADVEAENDIEWHVYVIGFIFSPVVAPFLVGYILSGLQHVDSTKFRKK